MPANRSTARGLIDATPLPRHEAERLIVAVCGCSRAEVMSGLEVTEEQALRYSELVARRRSGEPLQHLEGKVQFGPIELKSDRRALVPRPETEYLWEQAVAALGEAGPGTVIVDLCTGSGNLALALKHRFPSARVYGTDQSAEALALAAENSAGLNLDVTFLCGDLFAPLPRAVYGRVDLLVANPPYLADSEVAALPVAVRDHDPRQALVAGPHGDEVLSRIAEHAYWWLGTGGWLFCEIGERQGERALQLFGSHLDVEVRPDLTGRPRILVGRKGARCCG